MCLSWVRAVSLATWTGASSPPSLDFSFSSVQWERQDYVWLVALLNIQSTLTFICSSLTSYFVSSPSGTELDAGNLYLDKAGCLPSRNLLYVWGKDRQNVKYECYSYKWANVKSYGSTGQGCSIQRIREVGRLPSIPVFPGPQAKRMSCSVIQVIP